MNCESNLCLDARADGTVQVSSCSANNPELRNQQWDANTPSAQNIQNRGLCIVDLLLTNINKL